MRLFVLLLLLLALPAAFAQEPIPYLQIDARRSTFTSDSEPPIAWVEGDSGGLAKVDKNAKAVFVSGNPSEEGWSILKAMPALEELRLDYMYDAKLGKHLAEMPNLKRISFDLGGNIEPSAYENMGALRPTEFLMIEDYNPAVADLLPLIQVPLRVFISGSSVMDESTFKPLLKQQRLESVQIYNASLKPGAAAVLAACLSLKHLDLTACAGIDSEFCAELAKSTSLVAIGGRSAADDTGLTSLLKIKTLKHLSLAGSGGFTTEGLIACLKKSSLESLELKSMQNMRFESIIDDAIIQQVGAMKSLRWLRLEVDAKITPKAFEKLGGLKELRWLYLEGDGQRDGASLAIVSGMKKLRGLSWNISREPEAGVFKSLPKTLRKLRLDMRSLTGEHIKHIAALKQLEVLELEKANQLKSADLMQLAAVKTLTRLVAVWPEGTAKEFAEKRPDVYLGYRRD